MHLYEIVERFMRQGWANPNDIVDYLLEYGVALKHQTISAYVAQYQRYGTCKAPTTSKTKASRPANGPMDLNKLLQLKDVVEAIGGVPRSMTVVELIEAFGGVKRFRTALTALTSLVS